MDTGEERGPAEHFSSFLNKNVIRRNTGGEKGAMRAFLIILNKNVMRNEYWRAMERGEHFSSVFNEDAI